MTPALTASIREALGKPYLSEEACRRVAVAVLEGCRGPGDDVAMVGMGEIGKLGGRASSFIAASAFDAMIEALLSEIRG